MYSELPRSILLHISEKGKENAEKKLKLKLLQRRRNIHVDRETVLQNIMFNYGKYGITEDMVNKVIDTGLEGGLSYDFIYLDVCRKICEITGEEFFCTSSDMARAFGMSDEEMDRIIEEARKELIEAGQDPDEYFKSVETTRFMM